MSRTPISRPPAKTESAPARQTANRKGAPPGPLETLGALKAAPPKKAAPPNKTANKAAPAKAKIQPTPTKTSAPAKKTVAAKKPAPKPAKTRSERVKALNFTVTANFRKAFKLAAEAQNCKKVELLEMIFEEWQNRHPV